MRLFVNRKGARKLKIALTTSLVCSVSCIVPSAASAALPEKDEFFSFHLEAAPTPIWQSELAPLLRRLYPKALVEVQSETVRMHLWEGQLKQPATKYPNLVVIDFSVLEDINPNAFALPPQKSRGLPAQIKISRALINTINNDSELAFVLGHEIAHIRNDHFSVNFPMTMLTPHQRESISRTHQRWELAADQEALAQMKSAGFNELSSVAILNRLGERQSEKTSCLHNHPQLSERVERLKTSMVE